MLIVLLFIFGVYEYRPNRLQQTQKGLHSALTTECKQQTYKIFLACYYYQFVILTNIPLRKLKEKKHLKKKLKIF